MDSAAPHELVLVGLSHRTAPVEVRERCSIPKDAVARRLPEIKAEARADELLVLSTCNRTELIGVGADGLSLEQRLSATFPERARPTLYALHGAECVFHVFSVASGLRSMVVGEAEIQGQVKDAWRAARECGAGGPMLEAMVRQAIRAGKRVRTETELGSGSLSVAGAAVELITKVHGDLGRCSVLVVGTGETGLLLARHLAARGAKDLAFANRTATRAEQAARQVGAAIVPFERAAEAAASRDVIVACVEAPDPVLRAQDLAARRWSHRDLPKIFVDLSMPRAIDPAVDGLNGAFLFDLDALQAVVAQHLGDRMAEVEHAERIVLEEARKFLALRAYAALSPAVSELPDLFERARAAWAAAYKDRTDGDLDSASSDLARRLLAIALNQMKAGARLTQSEIALERSWRRYRERHP
jgi:glutamyl-tRNA reductase